MSRVVLAIVCLVAASALADDAALTPAQRRERVHIICHRGASEFAHENTLEAYRAAFELGADGNEIDIRRTRDGVLVCFHDDMLDRILQAYGDIGDYRWEEVQQFRYRNPGRYGEQCRMPTLEEVFELHRKYGGLMHLDIKRPMLDRAIIELLDKLDLWDHVAYCNTQTGGAILTHAKYKPCRYKSGLYLDHSEVFPEAIKAVLEKPGDGVIVDDPRGTILALGRKLGKVSSEPVSPRTPPALDIRLRNAFDMVGNVRHDSGWNHVAQTHEDQYDSGHRIRVRAQAADELSRHENLSPDAIKALTLRVRDRSLHKQWMYHGLDGEKALRTLLLHKSTGAAELARFVLWRDDPALEAVVNPEFKNPRSWTDWRAKTAVFPALASFPGADSEKLCRDYLALWDEEANKLGPPQFEQAGRALLAISPKTDTANELLGHRLQVVRGRTILDCLAHHKEPWAKACLEKHASHALAYIVE